MFAIIFRSYGNLWSKSLFVNLQYIHSPMTCILNNFCEGLLVILHSRLVRKRYEVFKRFADKLLCVVQTSVPLEKITAAFCTFEVSLFLFSRKILSHFKRYHLHSVFFFLHEQKTWAIATALSYRVASWEKANTIRRRFNHSTDYYLSGQWWNLQKYDWISPFREVRIVSTTTTARRLHHIPLCVSVHYVLKT